ncbi:thioesterase II family protein [Rhodococcus wratislaviensis]|uniref:Uncharacterized protein n=1 Tax=Rhodococcus wratislaviensis NBRC 100605 TaxID=1219028 RepID=X0PY39_RHOWR|nr:hypothetical protein [Rhodococcus wratislaviensis]GAF43317.1 hypothetical protein RW1_006_02150 [Rhodococcus wratislaviensis NBRC 100605]
MNVLPIPLAGGGAKSFARWLGRVPPGVEPLPVRRSARAKRRATLSLPNIHDDVAGLLPDMKAPVSIYGHRRVAVLAFGLTHIPDPADLFVSERRAPKVRASGKPIVRLEEDQFVPATGAAGRTTFRSRAFPWCTIPRIKAVRGLGNCDEYRQAAPLIWLIKAFVGTGDPAADTGEVEAWRSDTVSAFAGHTSEGDHYGHHTHRGTVAVPTGQVSERTNDAIAS